MHLNHLHKSTHGFQKLHLQKQLFLQLHNIKFISIFTGIKEKLIGKLHPFSLLKLTESIEFVGKAGNVHSKFIIRELGSTRLTAPRARLENVTFGQFIFSDAYYSGWMEKKEEKVLNNLLATLYLLPEEIFFSDSIPDRISAIEKIDLDTRKAIAFNYGLILMWLQQCYPLIFQSKNDDPDSVETHSDASLRPNRKQSGWITLFESMVADDLINRDRYAELPIHAVLRHLTAKYKENARR